MLWMTLTGLFIRHMECAGLMISALARAGAVLKDATYVERAVRAAQFVREHLHDAQSGRLLRSCYRGEHGQVAQK